jgi:large subunit ribosomal protein L25
MKVEAISRNVQGTGASRRLRREGKVPAIVYGGNAQPVNIELDHNSIFHAMRKEAFHSSVLELTVDGKAAGQVLLRDYQMHAFKPIVMHVDFQRIDANQKLHKKVPLHFSQLQLPAGVEAVHHGNEDPAVATAVLPRGAKEEEAPVAAPAAVPATAQKADNKK